MLAVRELMTPEARCVGEDESLSEAARLMRDLGVGSLPICGTDNRLKGMVTDRDIVVRCVAEGSDPATMKAGDLARGEPVTVDADAPAEEALRTMAQHLVRRLPVLSGRDLVGMVAQADVARALPPDLVGRCLADVSTTREPDTAQA
ncbi:CBS domain-containing protein [Microlunatus parietis]|uniref:CBS domain-containing protein n=1 Tax=Microlunatus parietis TaxID=682979 RepID=A0A7Y9I4T4_9ACTN|nr:CBS domain-containing protein [Microlunatus parietis]NYE70041.1 CBS domain-containing protein [Microlunatus parietis]